MDRAILLFHPTFHKKYLEYIDMLLDNDYSLKLIFNEIVKLKT